MSIEIKTEHIKSFSAEVFRVAESQQKVATNTLVDTLEEQKLLEDMLDRVKPRIPKDCEHYDYLIYTPFRYPPLKHGSRFGEKIHPSLFYVRVKQHFGKSKTALASKYSWLPSCHPFD